MWRHNMNNASTQEGEQADFCQSKVSLDYRTFQASQGYTQKNKEKEGEEKTAENSRWDSQEQPGKEMEEEERDKTQLGMEVSKQTKGRRPGSSVLRR